MSRVDSKRFLIVRHGETSYVFERRYQGQMDIPLNARGRAQAQALARYLAQESIQYIFSSDLSRARATAEPVAQRKELPIQVLKTFRERSFGYWEGMTLEEISNRYPEEVVKWRKRPLSFAPGGGEYFFQVRDRAKRAWKQVCATMSPGETALVVTHGGLIRALFSYLFGLKNEFVFRLKPANAALSIVIVSQGQPQLHLFNETCYLKELATSIEN